MEQEGEYPSFNQSESVGELGSIVAFVGQEVQFSGVLTYKGNVRIDGTFDGEIETTDTLFIGERAIVKAKIRAGSVIASGRIKGEIAASRSIELKSPAVIDALLSTPRLSMDDGVIFNGKISMDSPIGKRNAKEPIDSMMEVKEPADSTTVTTETNESEGQKAR